MHDMVSVRKWEEEEDRRRKKKKEEERERQVGEVDGMEERELSASALFL